MVFEHLGFLGTVSPPFSEPAYTELVAMITRDQFTPS